MNRKPLTASTVVAVLASVMFINAPLGAQAVPKPVRRARGDTVLRQPSPTGNDTSRPRQDTTAGKIPVGDSLTRFIDKFSFRNLGPAAYSGRVTAIAVPKPFRKTIYIGSAGGGVWKTSNAGITWHPISDSLGNGSIGDIAVAPSDSNIIWVGTGEKNSSRSTLWGNGVHKSTNGGRKWQHMGLADTRSIAKIVISPSDPTTVYVAALGHLWGPNAERGVFKTTNGGRSWSKVLFVDDTTGAVDLAMDPSNPEVLYAAMWHRIREGGSHMQGTGMGSGIYKTVNGGRTWTRLTDPALANGLPTGDIGRTSISISAKHPSTVYAMIAVDRGVTNTSAAPFGGVFRSDDAGAHWTHVNDLAANPHYYYDELVTDPTNDNHVYMLASPLRVSKDGGRSFEADSLYNVHVDNHALWIDPADSAHMILGNDGGVYTTFDGGKAWEHAEIPIGQFYTVAIDSASKPYRICGGLQDNGVWCGPSSTRDTLGVTDADWYSVNGGDGMWAQISRTNPNIIYSESQFGSMSRLDMRTWKRDRIQPIALDAGGDSGYGYTWGWTTPLALSQHDTATLYVGGNHLFRIHDHGDKGVDWEVVGPDMTRATREHPEGEGPNTSYHALFSIAESPRTRDVIWTGSDDGLVWLTRDYGKTWTNLTANFPAHAPTHCFVSTIAASHFAEGTAYMTYDCHSRDDYAPHVYKTTNFGKSWSSISAGLPADAGALTVSEDPYNAQLLWVGTEIGVYVSIDGGAKWRRFGHGLPPVAVEKLAMSYDQRDLVLGTHGRGIWVVNVGPLEEMTDTLLRERAHLFRVSPALQFRYTDTYPSFGSRPFVAKNPPRGATISYYLRDALTGPVDLYILTAKGDTVRKLSGPGYAGLNQATWDLTSSKPRPRALGDPTSPADLKRVEPGDYVVTMKVAGKTFRQAVRVDERPDDLVRPPR
jgi:photosystem II stability/assembly factor-like uncharacterized protein